MKTNVAQAVGTASGGAANGQAVNARPGHGLLLSAGPGHFQLFNARGVPEADRDRQLTVDDLRTLAASDFAASRVFQQADVRSDA